MRRTNNYFSFNLQNITPYLPFLIMSAIYIVGILCGCITVGKFEFLSNFATEKFNEYFSIREELNFYSIFLNSLTTTFPLYIVMFLCGTSAVGFIASPIIVILNGFTYGCVSGHLCATYKLEGIMFNALVYLPFMLISAFGIIILSCESFSFSRLIAGICIKANKPVNIYHNFKTYCIRGLISLSFALISVLTDSALSTLFISFFDF